MQEIWSSPGSPFKGFQRSFVGRAPGPVGCLAMLVLCPIGLAIGVVMLIVSIFRLARRRPAQAFARRTPAGGAREVALRRLVSAFATDESFSADEARQAGTLVAGGATVDDLLADALERGWVEVRGERLAVTRRGRDETSPRE